MEILRHIDQQFFIAINNGLQNPFLNWLCPILRNQKNWYVFYVVLVYFIYRKYNKQTIWIILGAALLILISDQVSANLIKNTVQRLRPCNDPLLQSQVHLLVHCGAGYSFISAHAANHFALAFFVIGHFTEHRKWLFPIAILWASAIAFSQVYVGVHYPFDVICGALLGSALGYGVAKLIQQKIVKQA
jgi:membrane-associated phospholipid phosphatase